MFHRLTTLGSTLEDQTFKLFRGSTENSPSHLLWSEDCHKLWHARNLTWGPSDWGRNDERMRSWSISNPLVQYVIEKETPYFYSCYGEGIRAKLVFYSTSTSWIVSYSVPDSGTNLQSQVCKRLFDSLLTFSWDDSRPITLHLFYLQREGSRETRKVWRVNWKGTNFWRTPRPDRVGTSE